MKNTEEIVSEDLDYICEHLSCEFDQLSGKRVLITGGAGFLGYYLVQAILHHNRQVQSSHHTRLTVYDNYVRGVPDWLLALSTDANLTLVKHDITQPLPGDIGDFHYIIHAASIASPSYYRQYPIETMDANVNGLRALIEYARAQRVAAKPVEGFLFFSTSEIYGDPTPEDIPTPETYRGNVSSTGPRACYDESKRYGETLCVNFSRVYELPITIARPFNNYGPGLRMTDRRVLPDLACNVFSGQDITLLSDGSPTRTFCYIADAVVGYYKILLRGEAGEAYNIGVETPEVSMATLAQQVASISRKWFGYEGRVTFQTSAEADYLIDNPNRRCPVIAKARTHLGYNPSVSIEEGLERTLFWYREHIEKESW